jgi:hypothetical protein
MLGICRECEAEIRDEESLFRHALAHLVPVRQVLTMTRAQRLAQTGDCPSEYPDTCPDVDTCPVHDDGSLF